MNAIRRKSQVWHISQPKNILRLWRGTSHHNSPELPGKNGCLGSNENSKETLLSGELSDGRQHRRNPVVVPRGFLAVYVGPELRRFVIPATCLSMPDFRVLMERVAEEFGFEQEGGLRIPCEEEDFEEILTRCLARHKAMSKSKSKK